MTSLALRKHVSAPRWLVCILVSISGWNTIGMMTRFSLKVTLFWIVCSSPYNLYSLIHRGISSLVSGHLAKIVTFRACSWLSCFVSSRICTNYWSVTLANSSASIYSILLLPRYPYHLLDLTMYPAGFSFFTLVAFKCSWKKVCNIHLYTSFILQYSFMLPVPPSWILFPVVC